MIHFRRLVLCLFVAGAVGTAGAQGASAAPPEFVSGSPHGFESLLKATKLETVAKALITCKHGGNSGEVTGPKTLLVTITLLECRIPGALCNSSGASPGEIITPPLTGTLGYIKAKSKSVGLDLTSPSGPIMVFTCGALSVVVEGSVIGKIKPVNKLLAPGEHLILKFSQKAGIQKPQFFEGEPPDVLRTSLNGKPFEGSGLGGTDELVFAAPTEITG